MEWTTEQLSFLYLDTYYADPETLVESTGAMLTEHDSRDFEVSRPEEDTFQQQTVAPRDTLRLNTCLDNLPSPYVCPPPSLRNRPIPCDAEVLLIQGKYVCSACHDAFARKYDAQSQFYEAHS
jgi:hypothetical protein